MTETEAMQRWCPFSRVNAGNNRVEAENKDAALKRLDSYMRASTRCLGSACLAWRWQRDDAPDSRPSATDGYCGLAGKP